MGRGRFNTTNLGSFLLRPVFPWKLEAVTLSLEISLLMKFLSPVSFVRPFILKIFVSFWVCYQDVLGHGI